MYLMSPLDYIRRAKYNEAKNGKESLRERCCENRVILLLMLAVIIYTLYNYVAGNSEFGYFFIAMVMMGLPFVSMLNQLIQQLKNK